MQVATTKLGKPKNGESVVLRIACFCLQAKKEKHSYWTMFFLYLMAILIYVQKSIVGKLFKNTHKKNLHPC